MSDLHEEDHSGPIKTPKQMLWVSIASFVVPVFVIIALVNYVTAQYKPAAGAVNVEQATAARIAKVGSVAVRDPNRVPDTGEAVYTGQCISCHAAGPGPKLGDTAAWGPRIGTGFNALWASALKGKGGMMAQAGGDYSDHEIARAVVYMANAGGAKFEDPKQTTGAPAAAAAPAADDAAAKAAAAQVAAATAGAAAKPAEAGTVKVAAGAGKALYEQVCVACHMAGVANAPKTGDKAAWAPRIATGIDAMTTSVLKGKGVMPPKGGSAASDAEIRAAVEYLVGLAK
jgi:cytochrome c5